MGMYFFSPPLAHVLFVMQPMIMNLLQEQQRFEERMRHQVEDWRRHRRERLTHRSYSPTATALESHHAFDIVIDQT